MSGSKFNFPDNVRVNIASNYFSTSKDSVCDEIMALFGFDIIKEGEYTPSYKVTPYIFSEEEIEDIEEILNREYNYAEKELKAYKKQLNEILPDSKTEAFIEQYNLILRKNPDIDYRNMTKKLDNIFTNAMGADFVANMFLKAGYDGYTIDFEYVIFNFEKLNQNIVKDKNALLEKLMNNN